MERIQRVDQKPRQGDARDAERDQEAFVGRVLASRLDEDETDRDQARAARAEERRVGRGP